MNRIKESIGRMRAFFGEVQAELRKCSWPAGSELFESTVVVVVSVVLLSAFVAVSDGAIILVLRSILSR